MTRTGTLLLLTLAMACPASAHTVVIEGGKVHLRGELVNGSCAVAPDSQNMRIDMGQYRTNSFSGVGSFSTVNVPFTVRLLDCSVDVSRTVGIQFQGVTPAEDPQVFLATSRPGETPVSSGVGPGTRRRVFSARYLGDDARHAVRSWRTSPPFAGLADRLPDGAVMDDALFPLLNLR